MCIVVSVTNSSVIIWQFWGSLLRRFLATAQELLGAVLEVRAFWMTVCWMNMLLQLTECTKRLEPALIHRKGCLGGSRRSFWGLFRASRNLSEVLWSLLEASWILFEGFWKRLAFKKWIFSDFNGFLEGVGGAFWDLKSFKSRLKMDITISIAFEADFGAIFY